MRQYFLKMFNTGQITLPKQWRDKFPTKNFVVEETKDGLLVKPLLPKESEPVVVEYENEKEFGLIFPNGVDPQVLMDIIKEMDE